MRRPPENDTQIRQNAVKMRFPSAASLGNALKPCRVRNPLNRRPRCGSKCAPLSDLTPDIGTYQHRKSGHPSEKLGHLEVFLSFAWVPRQKTESWATVGPPSTSTCPNASRSRFPRVPAHVSDVTETCAGTSGQRTPRWQSV